MNKDEHRHPNANNQAPLRIEFQQANKKAISARVGNS